MIKELSTKEFKKEIWDFDKNKEWNYIGNKPMILEFMAIWCQPCKVIVPILEELSNEYEGKINIFKINVEEAYEVANTFGIQSIPAILFVPIDEKPQMLLGALPKKMFVKAIEEFLKIKNDN